MHPDDELRGLLRSVDHPVPNVAPADIAAIARQRAGARRLRMAAAVAALLVAAGTAYALPGSPVRAWLRSIGENADARSTGTAPADPGAGISLPAGRRLHIVFEHSLPGSVLHVMLTDDTLVTVLAPSGDASFLAEDDRLRVSNTTPGTFDIRIPRAAPLVDIAVRGTVVFRKEGEQVVTEAADGDGWRIPLGPR